MDTENKDMNQTGTDARERRVLLPNSVYFQEVREMLDRGMSVTVPVKGSSMLPFIRGGRDRVVLKKTATLVVGDIVLALVDGRNYVLHRVYGIWGDRIMLMGDGNLSACEYCSPADICGKVTVIVRNGRNVDVLSRKESFWAVVWRHLLPLRRYLLAAFRYRDRIFRVS